MPDPSRFPFRLALALLAAMACRPALADDDSRITTHVGGDLFLGVAAPLVDRTAPGAAGAGHRFGDAQADLLLRFRADAQLDDDLTGSAVIRLRAAQLKGAGLDSLYGDDHVKDAYLRLAKPSFGEFRLGDTSDAREQQSYYAPQICTCGDGFFGSNSPSITFNNGPVGTNSTAATFDNRATKLEWFSPEVENIRLAISYAPDRGAQQGVDDDRPEQFPAPGDANGGRLGEWQNFVSGSLAYSDTFGSTNVILSGGYSHAGHRSAVAGIDDESPYLWNLSARVEYGPWKFGAAWEREYHGNLTNGVYGVQALKPASLDGGVVDTNVVGVRSFDLGFTYSLGPVTAGVAWSRGLYAGITDPSDPARAAANDVIFTGASWQAQEHVLLLAGIQVDNYDAGGRYVALPAGYAAAGLGNEPGVPADNNPYARSYTGVMLVFGTAIRF